MKTLKITLLLILLCGFFGGCNPTGLRSYIVLTTSKNPQDQREATEELMRLAREGSIVDQIKAEGHLRQLSQSAITEQQELALKPLVWFTFVSDDGYVQERSLSRLQGILTHQEWSEAYKLKTIVEVSEFIFGRLGTTEEFKNKKYYRHTGHPGGIKEITPEKLLEKNKPGESLKLAVKRMLPGGVLGRKQLTKLKIYAGEQHPHAAQNPKVLDLGKLNSKNLIRN